MFRIPTVLTADEIVNKAFSRASKVSVSDPNPYFKAKKTATQKVSSAMDVLHTTLYSIVKKFPSIDNLPKFYSTLIHIQVNTDRLKHCLGSVDWAAQQCNEIGKGSLKKIKRYKTIVKINKEEQAAFGRMASVVKQVQGQLDFLAEAREYLRKLPTIDPEVPTVVVAGFPNVGKSNLVATLSTASPKVASYPFTTKKISVGHIIKGRERVQIIDTPGLLDRVLEDRNPMELQAIAALEHLADLIIFLEDRTGHCGFTIEHQVELRDEVKRTLPDIPMVVIHSKVDLKREETEVLCISCITGEGIEGLLATIFEMLQDAK